MEQEKRARNPKRRSHQMKDNRGLDVELGQWWKRHRSGRPADKENVFKGTSRAERGSKARLQMAGRGAERLPMESGGTGQDKRDGGSLGELATAREANTPCLRPPEQAGLTTFGQNVVCFCICLVFVLLLKSVLGKHYCRFLAAKYRESLKI